MLPNARVTSCAIALAATLGLAEIPGVAHAQETDPGAIDARAIGSRLVAVVPTPCTPAQETFGAAHCATLIARDPTTHAEQWRTPLPIPIRGLLQLDALATASGPGVLVRAHDRGVVLGGTGLVERVLDVPTSTLAEPVGVREAHGALVFLYAGGCSALVTSLSDPTVRVALRGVESHLYPPGGGPHHTVCMGFSVEAVGEVRIGTRPAGRGRRGERRHGIAALVVVAVRALAHPTPIGAPTLIGLGANGVVWQRAVAAEDALLDEVRMTGSGSSARCTAVVRAGDRRSEVTVACADGRVIADGSSSPAR